MTDAVDQKARDDAREAIHAVNNFRGIADVQFRQLEQKIDSTHADTSEKIERIESAIKWAGGLIVSLVIAVLGWSVLQQINANEVQKQDLQRQIVLLQQQEAAQRLQIQSSPPRAAEAPVAAVGAR